MSYTFTSLVGRVKLKAFTSSASGLSDANFMELAADSFRSYVVPFLKSVRDEWFVAKDDYVATTDSDSRISLPDSVASTIRTISYSNNGVLVPLTRVEPENAFGYQQQTSSVPVGYVLRGYQVILLPQQSASFEIHIAYMRRPPEGVLEDAAGHIESHANLALTLEDVPLAWQSSTPTEVGLISDESPYSVVAEEVEVVSLVGSVLTLTGISASLIEDGFWVSDVGTSPYPNIPIELHPLLEQDVVCTVFQAVGDKRLEMALQRKDELEKKLLKQLTPRAQGSARNVVNPSAPGMRGFSFWNTWGRGNGL